MFKWIQGRQGTGYEKFPIIAFSFLPFDVYLLRYKPGSSIPWHTDVVPGKRHYRLNVFLRKARVGGAFLTDNSYPVISHSRYHQLFRPDMSKHCVTQVQEGTRYVLSIGLAI